ncbi:MAG: putative baseplate assembly protein [Chloroflexi bacterium]|nr:putative baseplate assembly protein [Chloroflexota bacterium]
MTLLAPVLDDRHFQDIVDEAKKRIPQHCEEWTDHNVSDPGVTLIELFAWMTDMILYRMNQMPQRHYIKFLEMLGITLDGPVPAQVPATFWLSAPQETAVLIPGGTEVASTQTETERAIVFTTTHDFMVNVPALTAVLSQVATQKAHEKRFIAHHMRHLTAGYDTVEVFSIVPQIDDALYFGFSNDLSYHILGLEMEWDTAGGAGIDPTLPPYVWEVATNDETNRWQPCKVELDSTRGLNAPGQIHLHLPQMHRYRINDESLYWVRIRIKDISPAEMQRGMQPYQVSPKLKQLTAQTWGGTSMSIHAQTIKQELMGRSDGTPGQQFKLRMVPILERQPGEALMIEANKQREVWTEVEDFTYSTAEDKHFSVDSITGVCRFGPAIRQRDGSMRMYGAIPPRSATATFQRYRTGGGLQGNVDVGVLNTLKTAIPYIARVSNRFPAQGGLDAESLESAMMRAPMALQSRDRAMSATDFEYLSRRALPAKVARVRCLQARPADVPQIPPGQVFVLVVPKVRYPAGYLSPEELQFNRDDLDTITAFLDERRLLTTSLNVRPPAYRWVSVQISLGVLPGFDEGQVEQGVLARLYQFLNPLTGGSEGTGWSFGRDLFLADIYQCLQGAEGVAFIRSVDIYTAVPGGDPVGQPVESIDVVAHGVIASGVHQVTFI